MQCKEAQKYIMKYMDNELSEYEAQKLNSHIIICNDCKKDFFIYDEIINNLKDLPEYEAPKEFEKVVMSKIEKISEKEYNTNYSANNKMVSILLCFFSVLFSIATVLIIFRENIVISLLNNPYIGEQIEKFIPVSIKITEQGEIIKNVANNTFNILNDTVSNSIGIIFGILAIVCAVQFVILRRKKSTK